MRRSPFPALSLSLSLTLHSPPLTLPFPSLSPRFARNQNFPPSLTLRPPQPNTKKKFADDDSSDDDDGGGGGGDGQEIHGGAPGGGKQLRPYGGGGKSLAAMGGGGKSLAAMGGGGGGGKSLAAFGGHFFPATPPRPPRTRRHGRLWLVPARAICAQSTAGNLREPEADHRDEEMGAKLTARAPCEKCCARNCRPPFTQRLAA